MTMLSLKQIQAEIECPSRAIRTEDMLGSLRAWLADNDSIGADRSAQAQTATRTLSLLDQIIKRALRHDESFERNNRLTIDILDRISTIFRRNGAIYEQFVAAEHFEKALSFVLEFAGCSIPNPAYRFQNAAFDGLDSAFAAMTKDHQRMLQMLRTGANLYLAELRDELKRFMPFVQAMQLFAAVRVSLGRAIEVV